MLGVQDYEGLSRAGLTPSSLSLEGGGRHRDPVCSAAGAPFLGLTAGFWGLSEEGSGQDGGA